MNTLYPSRDEREHQRLSPENLQRATESLWNDGYLVLKNVVTLEHIDILKTKTLTDLETILARPDAPFNFNVGNVQQDPPPFHPFLFKDILLNSFVIQISNAVLGTRPQLTMYSGNTALPGGERQPVHPDIGQLWPNLQYSTPAFCLVVNVPLVDVDARNGATEYWPGTHQDNTFCIHDGAPRIGDEHLEKWRSARPPFQVTLERGDIAIRDIRMWHAGMPNQTDEPRPMIAMTHWASWASGGAATFSREAEEWLSHPALQMRANFVDGEVDYLNSNTAYDLQQ